MSEVREPSLWIMAVLAHGRTHGYGIVIEVNVMSEGSMLLKIPTLYAALDRLTRQGIVEPDGDEDVGGRTRRYFRLTDKGVAQLKRDAQRLDRMARVSSAAVRLIDGRVTA